MAFLGQLSQKLGYFSLQHLVTLDMPFKDCCAKCHEAKCRNGLESLQRTNKKLNILKGKKGFKDFLNILL